MIQIRNLCKNYDRQPVLRGIDLEIPPGVITGLLGPNGAGKTTLVSILTGIVPKDSGRIHINGLDLERNLGRIQGFCAIVPQSLALYPMLTAYENLEYFGALHGLGSRRLRERIDFCVSAARLEPFLHKRVARYSGGMQRRLNLAIGLLNTPKVLYLDEPTVGVDPQSRAYILKMIRDINQAQSTTIIYTSHYMEEIEQISDHIAILDEGRLILHDTKAAVLARCDQVTIETGGLDPAAKAALSEMPQLVVDDPFLRFPKDAALNRTLGRVCQILDQHQVQTCQVSAGRQNLEALFLNLTSTRLRDG